LLHHRQFPWYAKKKIQKGESEESNVIDEPRFDAVDSPGFVAGADVATNRAVIAEMGATLNALRWPWRRLYYVVTAYNERSTIVAQLTALSHGYGVNVAKQVMIFQNPQY
jgi:hypothetical protein